MASERHGVERIVTGTHRATALAYVAEAVLVGAFASLTALAAIAWQGSTLASLGAWGAALLAGGFAGASWWLSVRVLPADIARRIDRSLGHKGGFVTAWEGVSRSRPSGLVLLLARGIQKRTPLALAKRAVLPNSMPFLALPFLGATLLAIVRSDDGGESLAPDWVPRVAGFAAAMGDVEAAARAGFGTEEIDADVLRELVESSAAARQLERRAELGDCGPDEARPAVEELLRELDSLTPELSPLSDLAQALERATSHADSLLMAEEGPLGAELPPSTDPGTDLGADLASERANGPAGPPVAQRGPGAGLDFDGAADPELTNASGEGTMVDRSDRRDAEPEASASSGEADGALGEAGPAGVASGRWWSKRDGRVIELWQERLRASAGRPAKGED